MNKTTRKNTTPSVGFSITMPLPINSAVRDAAWKEQISVNQWVLTAIKAKLEANGK